jgi:hypothetical protein
MDGSNKNIKLLMPVRFTCGRQVIGVVRVAAEFAKSCKIK